MEMSLVVYYYFIYQYTFNIIVAYYNVPYRRSLYVSKKAVRSEKFSFSFSSGSPLYSPLLEALSCLRTIMSGYLILFHNTIPFRAFYSEIPIDGGEKTI